MAQTLDPVVFATLANRLDGVVRESMQACLQSARSSVLQARDLSASISDSSIRLITIAQGVPVHVLASNMSIAPIPELFDDIQPGDCFLNNSPFLGCAHHADYSFCTPVFYDDRLMFWVMLRAHQADTGAPQPTVYLPFAKDVSTRRVSTGLACECSATTKMSPTWSGSRRPTSASRSSFTATSPQLWAPPGWPNAGSLP